MVTVFLKGLDIPEKDIPIDKAIDPGHSLIISPLLHRRKRPFSDLRIVDIRVVGIVGNP